MNKIILKDNASYLCQNISTASEIVIYRILIITSIIGLFFTGIENEAVENGVKQNIDSALGVVILIYIIFGFALKNIKRENAIKSVTTNNKTLNLLTISPNEIRFGIKNDLEYHFSYKFVQEIKLDLKTLNVNIKLFDFNIIVTLDAFEGSRDDNIAFLKSCSQKTRANKDKPISDK